MCKYQNILLKSRAEEWAHSLPVNHVFQYEYVSIHVGGAPSNTV